MQPQKSNHRETSDKHNMYCRHMHPILWFITKALSLSEKKQPLYNVNGNPLTFPYPSMNMRIDIFHIIPLQYVLLPNHSIHPRNLSRYSIFQGRISHSTYHRRRKIRKQLQQRQQQKS